MVMFVIEMLVIVIVWKINIKFFNYCIKKFIYCGEFFIVFEELVNLIRVFIYSQLLILKC